MYFLTPEVFGDLWCQEYKTISTCRRYNRDKLSTKTKTGKKQEVSLCLNKTIELVVFLYLNKTIELVEVFFGVIHMTNFTSQSCRQSYKVHFVLSDVPTSVSKSSLVRFTHRCRGVPSFRCPFVLWGVVY